MISFLKNPSVVDFRTFLTFSNSKIAGNVIKDVIRRTVSQSNDPLWHELRFCRITASIVYEASNCQTLDGSLIMKLLCDSSKFDTTAMKRGRDLEDQIRKEVNKLANATFKPTGLHILSTHAIFAASPDGKLFLYKKIN